MQGVRQRGKSDCGVAALATAMGWSYDWAFSTFMAGQEWAFRTIETGYMGVSAARMLEAISWERGPADISGSRLPDAKGSRGVAYVVSSGEWDDKEHWLAWEKQADGRVLCFNPSDGESFDSSQLHARGYRLVSHISVEG